MSHPLLVRLRDADPAERRAACCDAVDDPSAILLLPALSEALGDPVREVARAASDALVRLDRKADGVRRVLDQALRGEDPARRWVAATTWARLEPPPIKLLPVLVQALGAEERELRWSSARLLVEMGSLHGEVLPLLAGLSRSDESAPARRMAVHALRALARVDPMAGRAIVEATGDTDLRVRRAAFAALSALSDPPERSVERLLVALRSDPDAATRRIASVALGELGAAHPELRTDEVLAALRQAADAAEDPDLRRGAARALRRLQGGTPSRRPPEAGAPV